MRFAHQRDLISVFVFVFVLIDAYRAAVRSLHITALNIIIVGAQTAFQQSAGASLDGFSADRQATLGG